MTGTPAAPPPHRSGGRPWAGRLFYAVSVLLILVSLVLLNRLRRSFENDLNGRIEQLQRVFADRDLLKLPNEHQIRFAAIEDLASKYRNDRIFESFTVTKMFGAEERVIYPYYIPALFPSGERSARPEIQISGLEETPHPLPWSLPGDARVLPLALGDQLLGRLYVRVNEGPLNVVRAVLGALTALLLGAVSLFALQFRRQERVISRTTVELEEKRRELVRIERLALAGQLSANILHDLKKPVLNIKSEAEELATESDVHTPPSPEEAASRIRQQVDLFFGILRESSLERFVRAQGEREYVDINELLDRSLSLVRYERHDVDVERRYTPGLSPVLAEPVRLVQVFSNLILNAYQAMDGRGQLLLESRLENSSAVVVIQDSGPGIPSEALDQIFLPFFSTKPEGTGTGLGLYITRDIILDVGGTIQAENAPAAGARFTISLPLPS